MTIKEQEEAWEQSYIYIEEDLRNIILCFDAEKLLQWPIIYHKLLTLRHPGG